MVDVNISRILAYLMAIKAGGRESGRGAVRGVCLVRQTRYRQHRTRWLVHFAGVRRRDVWPWRTTVMDGRGAWRDNVFL